MSCLANRESSSLLFTMFDESLAQWLDSLKYKWQVRGSLYPESVEVADLKENGFDAHHNTIENLPIMLQGLWEKQSFLLDNYRYEIFGTQIERKGPKVKSPPPAPEWKVTKIITGAPITT